MTKAKSLRERLTPALLQALSLREKTNKEVAKELGVHPVYLSTTYGRLVQEGIAKPRTAGPVNQARLFMKELVQCRRLCRLEEARAFSEGRKTLAKAAEAANCSERTLRRYVKMQKGSGK